MLKNRRLAVIFLTMLSACSSSQKLTDRETKAAFIDLEYLCTESKGRKVVSTISSKFTMPKGIGIADGTRKSKEFRRVEDHVVDNFILHLLSSVHEIDQEGNLVSSQLEQMTTLKRKTKLEGFPHATQYLHPISSLFPIYRSKGFSFVLLNQPQSEVIDPVSKVTIEASDKYPYSVTEFAKETGFYGGSFLLDFYFSVPDREREGLCKKAGLNTDCFELPKDKKTLKRFADFTSDFTFTHLFIMQICGNCDHDFADDNRFDTLEKFKKDPMMKIKWVSAMALDLSLMIGTKITKSIDGDWKINRVEWDPSIICKYRRPKSDFLTK